MIMRDLAGHFGKVMLIMYRSFHGVLWKCVMIISKLHLIPEEEGRIAHERQKSAVLFVSERSCY